MGAVVSEIKTVPAWREHFRTLSELDEGEVPMLIENILPSEGISFLGSLSGVGKTWIALSKVKALRTGKPLFGRFRVPEIVPCAYFVPEMGSRAVRHRIEMLRIPSSEEFLIRTLKEGIMHLDSPHLRDMIQALMPVVFLDTAIRFMRGKDENSASENSVGLADALFHLLRLGARAVRVPASLSQDICYGPVHVAGKRLAWYRRLRRYERGSLGNSASAEVGGQK